MHVHKDLVLLSTLLATLEDSLDVFIHAFASQEEVDPAKDCLSVSGRRVVVPEKAGIRRDSQPALA
jgi:hypothetical protein